MKEEQQVKTKSVSRKELGFVWLASVIVQLGFGAYGVILARFAKENDADPLIFHLYRKSGAAPILFLAAYIAEGHVMVPNIRELPLFVIMGFFCIFLGQLSNILGVYYVSPDITSMLQPVVPVWTFIVAAIARVEKLPNIRRLNGILKLLGVLLAVGGAFMLTFGKQKQHKTNEVIDRIESEAFLIFGYLCILYNTISMALLAILQKKYIFNNADSRWKSSPFNVIAWSYFFGFLSMALTSLYYCKQPEKFLSVNNSTIYVLIYAVLITSVLNYILITWIMTKISATLVTAFWPLQVLFCVILANFIIGETLNELEICGGILTIFSLLAVVWSNYREEKERAAEAKNKVFHEEKEPLLSSS